VERSFKYEQFRNIQTIAEASRVAAAGVSKRNELRVEGPISNGPTSAIANGAPNPKLLSAGGA